MWTTSQFTVRLKDQHGNPLAVSKTVYADTYMVTRNGDLVFSSARPDTAPVYAIAAGRWLDVSIAA